MSAKGHVDQFYCVYLGESYMNHIKQSVTGCADSFFNPQNSEWHAFPLLTKRKKTNTNQAILNSPLPPPRGLAKQRASLRDEADKATPPLPLAQVQPTTEGERQGLVV